MEGDLRAYLNPLNDNLLSYLNSPEKTNKNCVVFQDKRIKNYPCLRLSSPGQECRLTARIRLNVRAWTLAETGMLIDGRVFHAGSW
jgi:hypothetical protein